MSPHNGIPDDVRGRVAIDLGAESYRVSLLQWRDGSPFVRWTYRIANGPVHLHSGNTLYWPLDAILSGLEYGLRTAATIAPEGIASIAVDGWAVDYVRIDKDGRTLQDPYCYRDERTIATRLAADSILPAEDHFRRAGAQPLRINTVYQLMADRSAGIDPRAPWICLPEYVLHWLGARRVAEYTNATHTGLVDLQTGDWSHELFDLFDIPIESAPPIVPAGSIVGCVKGPLADLEAFRDTLLIAPACHDTASAIAGIPADMQSTAYICSGTWSLVGTMTGQPVTSPAAMQARYTNQGAAGGGYCFHSNVNGMWLLKQCMEAWSAQGRLQTIEDLVSKATAHSAPGIIDVDAESLMLDGNMPERINAQLILGGHAPIADIPGNEPIFARTIFESLASRYADALDKLEQMLDRRLDRIHVLGGGSRNKLLIALTAERTGLSVEAGEAEGSTIGNFAVQLAVAENANCQPTAAAIRQWAQRLFNHKGA